MKALLESPFAHWFLSPFSDSLVRCVLEGAVPSLQSLYLDSEELREECVMWVTSHSTFLNHGRKSFMWSTVDWCQSTNISWYLWESGTDSTSIFGNVFKVSKPNPELGWVLYVGPVFCSSYSVIKHLASLDLARVGFDWEIDHWEQITDLFLLWQNVRSYGLTSHVSGSTSGKWPIWWGSLGLRCRSSILTTWNPPSLTFPCFFCACLWFVWSHSSGFNPQLWSAGGGEIPFCLAHLGSMLDFRRQVIPAASLHLRSQQICDGIFGVFGIS